MISSLDFPGVLARAQVRSMSARGRGRLPWALGGLTAVLLLAGCGGQSSSDPSTHSTASVSTRPATGASTTQPAVSSSVGAATTVTGSSGGVTTVLHAGTHHPRVGRPWPIRFTVSSGGRPARASVSYEYLLGSQVVAHRSHYTFTGHFADVFRWPAAAVGYLLTFRAVILADGATLDLDYPVRVVG
jgi:hypothetical protein